ncbi:MAG: type II toxin-antitoxin system RelE/ParE family toxin [Candidatus Diapherotrites archaeon]|nr:type II toxin-antitoxin system RelE/ParE family toxin [Candidatus Diapherotrites archaeon]
MSFSVRLSERAARDVRKLPHDVRKRILLKLSELRGFPDAHLDVIPVAGESDTYRLRVGKYRAIFVVFWDAKTIVVTRVSKRSVAYR